MVRLAASVLAGLAGVASGVSRDSLAEWAYSSRGLDLSRPASEALADKEYQQLSLARASIDSLSKLKQALYSPSGLDLSKSYLVESIFPLADARVDVAELQSLYKALYSSRSGDLSKEAAQAEAMKLAKTRTQARDIPALWSALYSSSGLDLEKSEAQRWIVDLTAAGTDVEKLKSAYRSYARSSSQGDAVKWAIQDAVIGHLGGLPERYAKDGKAYNAESFKSYYYDLWVTEWLRSPEERRTANDGGAYTAAEFQVFYGDSWAKQWGTSPVTEQRRLAADGKVYTLQDFVAYYQDSWQQEWATAGEVADGCAFLNREACDAAMGQCVWKWSGDWTDSCVVSRSADILVV